MINLRNPVHIRRPLRNASWASTLARIDKNADEVGVPYGNRTRVAAVKEKRFTGILSKLAAWIAPQGSQRNSKDLLLDP